MDSYSGIVMLQSQHPKFIQCYTKMVEVVDAQEGIYHSQSCSFHKLTSNHTLIITAGYLLAKFGQSIGNYTIEEIKKHVKFGLLKNNNSFIELNLIHIGFDDWTMNKLSSFGFEIEVGFILYLEMVNNNQFKILQKYSRSHLKQGQELITISSPFAIQGQEMYKNYFRKAHVSQIFTDSSSKQLFMLDLISQLGQEGGSVFNSKGEYSGMILQNRQIGHMNNKYFSFCVNWEVINHILKKKSTILDQSFFNSKIIDYILSVSQFVRQNAGGIGTGTIIADSINNKSYILTASHVLHSHLKGSQILVGTMEIKAHLLEDCINDMDFALAQLSIPLKGIDIQELNNQKMPKVGDAVYAVGFLYRLFEDNPCLAKGTIIKLIYDSCDQIVSIVTDCFIHNGYSGGGLFSEEGLLLGIISFNIGHASDGIICDLSYITPILPFSSIFQDLAFHNKVTEKSITLFSLKNNLAKDIRTLQTTKMLPQIGFKPKL